METMENTKIPIWKKFWWLIYDSKHFNSKQIRLQSRPVGGAGQNQSGVWQWEQWAAQWINFSRAHNSISVPYSLSRTPLLHPVSTAARGQASEHAGTRTLGSGHVPWQTERLTHNELGVSTHMFTSPVAQRRALEKFREVPEESWTSQPSHPGRAHHTNKNTNSVTWLYSEPFTALKRYFKLDIDVQWQCREQKNTDGCRASMRAKCHVSALHKCRRLLSCHGSDEQTLL